MGSAIDDAVDQRERELLAEIVKLKADVDVWRDNSGELEGCVATLKAEIERFNQRGEAAESHFARVQKENERLNVQCGDLAQNCKGHASDILRLEAELAKAEAQNP